MTPMAATQDELNGPVDLSNCEKEPIHIPGHVQNCGVLVAVDPQTLIIQQVSENCQELVGIRPQDLVTKPLAALFALDQMPLLQEVASGTLEENPLFICTTDVSGSHFRI